MFALRPFLLLILCGVLAWSVIRYQQSVNENTNTNTPEASESPEFFLDQSLTTLYYEDGSIDYQFNSEHIDYFKGSDSALAKNVYFIFFSKDGHTWHARSDSATFFNDSKEIQLDGNVRVWQPARNLELTTHTLRFDENRNYADTLDPVTINSPAGVTHSIGMNADLKLEKLHLLSAVVGNYHATK